MMAMVLMVGLSPAIEAKSARHFGQKRKLPSDDSRLPSGFRPTAPQNGVPSNLVHRVRELKNESYCAVFTLHVFRGRDRTDVGVPVDTQG